MAGLLKYLRAGKIVDAQNMLLETNHCEKFLWLCGSIPLFDNVSYSENVAEGNNLPNDLDRELNLQHIGATSEASGENVITGNRQNLMFVKTALDHIHANE